MLFRSGFEQNELVDTGARESVRDVERGDGTHVPEPAHVDPVHERDALAEAHRVDEGVGRLDERELEAAERRLTGNPASGLIEVRDVVPRERVGVPAGDEVQIDADAGTDALRCVSASSLWP